MNINHAKLLAKEANSTVVAMLINYFGNYRPELVDNLADMIVNPTTYHYRTIEQIDHDKLVNVINNIYQGTVETLEVPTVYVDNLTRTVTVQGVAIRTGFFENEELAKKASSWDAYDKADDKHRVIGKYRYTYNDTIDFTKDIWL